MQVCICVSMYGGCLVDKEIVFSGRCWNLRQEEEWFWEVGRVYFIAMVLKVGWVYCVAVVLKIAWVFCVAAVDICFFNHR